MHDFPDATWLAGRRKVGPDPCLGHNRVLVLNNSTTLGCQLRFHISYLVTLYVHTKMWKHTQDIPALGRSWFGQYHELDMKPGVNKHQLVFLVT